jgi:hypothetical protein
LPFSFPATAPLLSHSQMPYVPAPVTAQQQSPILFSTLPSQPRVPPPGSHASLDMLSFENPRRDAVIRRPSSRARLVKPTQNEKCKVVPNTTCAHR